MALAERAAHLVGSILIALVRLYQLTLSRVLPPSCRFEPSCSQYMIEAIAAHGVCRGLALGVWRVLRCNPWSRGGYDPVPVRKSGTIVTAGRTGPSQTDDDGHES